MKGRTPNAEEKAWMSAVCEFGCIVCFLELGLWTECCPHHMDGKTKPDAHKKSIGLCSRHHQISGPGYKSGHGDGKFQFEREHGSEEFLLVKTIELLGFDPPNIINLENKKIFI